MVLNHNLSVLLPDLPKISEVLLSRGHILPRKRNYGYTTRILSFQEGRKSVYFGRHTGRIATGVRSHSKSASKILYFVRENQVHTSN